MLSVSALLAGCAASPSSNAAVPAFTPAAGTYSAAQTVTISDATPGAVLYCTTDGTVPTSSSPVCNEPTTVARSETLSAIAAEPGGTASAVATAAYTINLPAAAAPVISPASGTYLAAQSVTITDPTPGSLLYYTTDGTTPSAASTLYSGPITLSTTQTLNAIAIASGYADSTVTTALFTINLPAPLPVITPAGGTFTGAQQATIVDPIAGATIYYTIDGSTPTQSSTQYSGAIPVSASETVNAVAIAPGYSLSPVATAVFNLVAATPTISPAGGSFTSVQAVTLADATANASIYYTVTPSGSAPIMPTPSSTLYTGPVSVAVSETISAIAVANGYAQSAPASAAFTVALPPAATPVISPAGGTFNSAQTVTLSDATSGAAIYYTTDGSSPSATNGTLYAGPVTVSASETIQAIAIAYGDSNSAIASAAFTLTVVTPKISVASGTYTSVQSVTLSDTTTGASIYYTTDGSTPGISNGTLYTGPISVSTSETLQAVATLSGYSNSAVASAAYTINLPAASTPAISPSGGSFGSQSEPSVTITDATSGASIYYTLDGSLPSATNGTLYTAPFTASQTETVKALAVASGYSSSAVASATFTINQAAAANPAFSPAGGNYSSAQQVSLSDTTPGAKVYYTTDGSAPSATHGTLYTGAIAVSATETIKAIATATGFNNSAVASATFTITLAPAPTPVFSPVAGTFNAPQDLTITDSVNGAAIYYTTDGSTPTADSTLYNGTPITVSVTETVNAIAIAAGYSNSTVASATFTLVAATPVLSPAGGSFTGATDTVTITDATPNTSIYYTITAGTSGTVPTTASTPYTGAFTVSATDTVEAIAIENGYTSSDVASATFTKVVSAGPAITGTVLGGTAPIIGASVQAYAAGTTGYGSSPTLLGTAVTTGANGTFDIPYTCPSAPGNLIYVVATGGSVSATGASNSGLAMMTALGPCASLPTASITVNEITTIASVYSLSGFATPASGGGINVGAPATGLLSNGTCPIANIGAVGGNPGCNYSGLVNAFATVNNLVDIGGGAALTITPAYAAAPVVELNTSSVPQARIDTLADILATCVDASSGCSTLFGLVAEIKPVDTVQAALGIALNPGTNVAKLYALVKTKPPYTPTLASLGDKTAPGDWTLAISYTGAGLGIDPNSQYGNSGIGQTTDTALAIDLTGNVWVTAYNQSANGYSGLSLLAGFSNLGAPLTPATTQQPDFGDVTFGGFGPSVASGDPFYDEPTALLIDQSENLWVADPNADGVVVFNPSGPGNPPLGVDFANGGLNSTSAGANAFAPSGTLWSEQLGYYTDGNGNQQFGYQLTETDPSTDAAILLANQFPVPSNSTNNQVCGFAFDSNGILWATDCGTSDVYVFNLSAETTPVTYTDSAGASNLVAGSSGAIYSCAGTSPSNYIEFNDSTNTTAAVATYPVGTNGCSSAPGFVAVDGANNLWSIQFNLSPRGYGLSEANGNTGAVLSPAEGYLGSSSAEFLTLAPSDGTAGIAIDASGDLWVLNTDTGNPSDPSTGNVLVEYVGLAAPTVTPLSVAVENGAQGTMP